MKTATNEVDLDHQRPHEIVQDEDVLSLELQRELESIGTAVGFVAAFALVCAHLARARRFVLARGAGAASTGAHDG